MRQSVGDRIKNLTDLAHLVESARDDAVESSEAEEMAIRASAAIISCLEISTLMKGIEMIRSALIKLGTVK